MGVEKIVMPGIDWYSGSSCESFGHSLEVIGETLMSMANETEGRHFRFNHRPGLECVVLEAAKRPETVAATIGYSTSKKIKQ